MVAACGDDAPDTQTSSGDDTTVLQAALTNLAQDRVDAGAVGIGVSVRLADGRRFEANAGFEAPDGLTPYDSHTTVQIIGSMTKTYVAVLIMQLVEAGQITLDDTVDSWVAAVPDGERITLRMLLNHTSGLGDYLPDLAPQEYARAWTPMELVQRGIQVGPTSAPGSGLARYSNTNFVLLALVLEAEYGMTWGDVIQQQIAGPLGAQVTQTAAEALAADRVAGGWFLDSASGEWRNALDVLHPSVGYGAGAMVASHRELARFIEAVFDGSLFADPSSAERMADFSVEVDPATLDGAPPTWHGLGMQRFVIGDLVLEGHMGHIVGYGACAFRDPMTGALIVVTVNVDDPFLAPLAAADIATFLRSR